MTVTVIDHPASFRAGTRVLLLKARHKDAIATERQVLRVSHDETAFAQRLDELVAMMAPGERIYVTASPRAMAKAIRLFKERQLAADYDSDPEGFYRDLWNRWVSCLMAPTSQRDKLWLFDCDAPGDVEAVMAELALHYDREMPPYAYASKSGRHIVVAPFDRTRLSERLRSLLHENPLMLWAYS